MHHSAEGRGRLIGPVFLHESEGHAEDHHRHDDDGRPHIAGGPRHRGKAKQQEVQRVARSAEEFPTHGLRLLARDQVGTHAFQAGCGLGLGQAFGGGVWHIGNMARGRTDSNGGAVSRLLWRPQDEIHVDVPMHGFDVPADAAGDFADRDGAGTGHRVQDFPAFRC